MAPVLLTRSRADNARLAALLRPLGVPVLSWQGTRAALLEPEEGRPALRQAVESAEIVVFTSRRGVIALRGLLGRGLGRQLAGRRVAAVGTGTAAAVERLERGLTCAWTGTAGAASLAALLVRELPPGTRLLLARGMEAPDVPLRSLQEAGLLVDDRRVYRQLEPPIPGPAPERAAAVVCASPSAARRVLRWQPALASSPFVAIGETTATTLRELGSTSVRLARSPSPESLLEAVLATLGMRGNP